MFTDTFAGIAPASVPAVHRLPSLGAALGAGLALLLYPDAATAADDVSSRTHRRRHRGTEHR